MTAEAKPEKNIGEREKNGASSQPVLAGNVWISSFLERPAVGIRQRAWEGIPPAVKNLL